MKLFGKRLLECLVWIAFSILITVIVLGVAYLFTTYNWLAWTLFIAVLIATFGTVVCYAWTFIHWLFIEPFRVSTRQRKGGDRT